MDADAEHYQANKDNEADWEEAPAPRRRSERRRLDAMVSVRFSPAEADLVRANAEAAGLSLSRYIRELALGRALASAAPRTESVGSKNLTGSPTEVRSSYARPETHTVAAA